MCEVISVICDLHLRQLLHARDLRSMKIHFFGENSKSFDSACAQLAIVQSLAHETLPLPCQGKNVTSTQHRWKRTELITGCRWPDGDHWYARHVNTNILAATVIVSDFNCTISGRSTSRPNDTCTVVTAVDHPKGNIYRSAFDISLDLRWLRFVPWNCKPARTKVPGTIFH